MDNLIRNIEAELGHIEIIDTLKDDDISKIYRIKLIDRKERYILKIKDTSFKEHQLELVKRLISMGLKIVNINYFKVIDEKNYILMEDLRGKSLDRVLEENIDIDTEELIKEIGGELYRIHTSEKVGDVKYIKQDNISRVFEIKTEIINNIKYLNSVCNANIVIEAIQLAKAFIEQSKENIYGVTHGDFHNLGNIVLREENNKYRFNKIVDLDSIRHGIYLIDIGMLYNILKQINLHELMVEEYSSNFSNKHETMEGIYIMSIYELLEILIEEIKYKNTLNITSTVNEIDKVMRIIKDKKYVNN